MIIFLYGGNRYLLEQKAAAIVDAYLKKVGDDNNLVRLDGRTIDTQRLATEILSMPFLSTSRLVVVREMGENKLLRDNAVLLSAKIPASTNLVLIDTKLDLRTNYAKAFTKIKMAQRFDDLTPPKLTNWALHTVKSLGGNCDIDTATYLIDHVGSDMYVLESEIRKLVLYSPMLTNDTIQLVCSRTPAAKAFDLVTEIFNQNQAKALALLDELIRQGEAALRILGLLLWQWRALAYAAAADESKTKLDWQALGLSNYAISKAQPIVRRYGSIRIVEGYKLLINADFAIKTGTEANLILQQVVHRLCVPCVGNKDQ